MGRILVIDDDQFVRNSFSRIFERMGHDVLLAGSLAQGAELAGGGVDVIYLDINLPDGDGLKAIDSLAATPWKPEIIVITGAGSHHGADRSLQSNAWDYIAKPATPQMVENSLSSALEYRKVAKTSLQTMPESVFDRCGILGKSPAMDRFVADIGKVAKSSANVLISGETGVGKELAARAIHANSERRGAPFVVVDCSNMTDTLVESMLYGHAKGSFTGAHAHRSGLVAEADGGTLFLDEVGELSLGLQKSFLRVLQERRYRPVGLAKERQSDFRLLAATNRDLNGMAQRGEFRSDLLFRIRTVEVVVPPLRGRGADKGLLAEYFIRQSCGRYGLDVKRASAELMDVVRGHHWPGNVRELASVMEAAVISAENDPVIYPKHLPGNVRLAFLQGDEGKRPPLDDLETGTDDSEILSYKQYKAERDREYFTSLLKAVEYDISKASRMSGLSVPSIYRHLSLNNIPTKQPPASKA